MARRLARPRDRIQRKTRLLCSGTVRGANGYVLRSLGFGRLEREFGRLAASGRLSESAYDWLGPEGSVELQNVRTPPAVAPIKLERPLWALTRSLPSCAWRRERNRGRGHGRQGKLNR